jgi:hypothetical protein
MNYDGPGARRVGSAPLEADLAQVVVPRAYRIISEIPRQSGQLLVGRPK